MTPNELLQRKPIEVSCEIGILAGCYYNHVPEAAIPYGSYAAQDRVEIRFYKNHYFDHRRIWALASVWFDGIPVMIIQNAGREGDDHAKRFVVDADAYVEMAQFIASLQLVKKPLSDVVSKDENLPLDDFYGYKLDDKFSEMEW